MELSPNAERMRQSLITAFGYAEELYEQSDGRLHDKLDMEVEVYQYALSNGLTEEEVARIQHDAVTGGFFTTIDGVDQGKERKE